MNNTFLFAVKHRIGREEEEEEEEEMGGGAVGDCGSDAITSVHSPLMGSAARYFFRSSVVTRID